MTYKRIPVLDAMVDLIFDGPRWLINKSVIGRDCRELHKRICDSPPQARQIDHFVSDVPLGNYAKRTQRPDFYSRFDELKLKKLPILELVELAKRARAQGKEDLVDAIIAHMIEEVSGFSDDATIKKFTHHQIRQLDR